MQIIGKVSSPFFLGHRKGDPHHITVFCDKEGQVYDKTRFFEAGIANNQIADFFEKNVGVIAELLNKPINQIGFNLNKDNIPLIVEFSA